MTHALVDRRAAMNALRGPVRLRTLITLRWLAVAGQSAAIVIVHFALGFPAPLGLCLGAIAASVWLNIFSLLRFSPQRILSDREAAANVSFDIIQLTTLLFFTGGLQNPFSALIIAPVTIAASLLNLRLTIMIAALALGGVSLLAVYHMPLPWRPDATFEVAPIYLAGVWAALSFSIVFFAAYAHRIAAESQQMRSALAATQLVLAREERMAALGGLAAAAAHELGTPLATIQLTAKEMLDELQHDEQMRDDAALLVSQAKRCRDILGRLSQRGDEGDAMHDRLSADALLREAADPFLKHNGKIEFIFDSAGAAELELKRRPEIIFGMRNFIENAASFAMSAVSIGACIDADKLTMWVHDDGPGFAPEILARLGEPYVSARFGARSVTGRRDGLGLGFFIAKTLLEGAGAQVTFDNRAWAHDPERAGAQVRAQWPVSAVSAAPIA